MAIFFSPLPDNTELVNSENEIGEKKILNNEQKKIGLGHDKTARTQRQIGQLLASSTTVFLHLYMRNLRTFTQFFWGGGGWRRSGGARMKKKNEILFSSNG